MHPLDMDRTLVRICNELICIHEDTPAVRDVSKHVRRPVIIRQDRMVDTVMRHASEITKEEVRHARGI